MCPDARGAGHAARRVGTKERGGGSSQGKQMCVVTFQDNFTKLCPHNFLFIIQVTPDMIAGVPEKCELSHWCHCVSPYNMRGSANSVLCRGRHFWKIARVNAH